MKTPQPPFDPATPFKYVGGDVAIDFVDTVDWTERGLENDRFASYERLLEWAEGAGVVRAPELEGLRRAAARDVYAAQQAVRDAAALRDLLERTFSRLVRGKRIDEEIAELNGGWLRRALAELALLGREEGDRTGRDGSPFVLAWPRASCCVSR
jgi:predicted RNA-binding Zn ribbon-like protein